MQTSKRAARRAEIEATAYRLLDEAGVGGLSIRALAKAARASNETLYRWYGDKAGLLAALVAGNTDLVRRALDDAAARSDGPLAQLRAVGPVLLHMVLSDRAVALNRAAAADTSGALGRAIATGGRDTVGPMIGALFARARRAGELGGDQSEHLIPTYLGLLIGDQQIRRVIGTLPAPSMDECRARADWALDTALQVARAGPARPKGVPR